MNFPHRGEIWLVALEPVKGHEIDKTRPAVIISNDTNNEFSDTVTILPITSSITKVYPFETLLESGTTAGLTVKSKVKCNQIRTVDKERMVKYMGYLSGEKLRQVEKSLLTHLEIEQENDKNLS
ncbi:MAG: type II toxin-antitoxin system PemK/MazF family toxin [Candidatus Omnitrophica bacterium]|nr:type II toxin-antitoxin system PemK/MazF family toxin [Candidatus Omnitrophota bacterium]